MMATQLSLRNIRQQIITASLALLFSYAAFSKLIDVETFEWQMLNQPLPRQLSKTLVWAIPSIEIVTVWLLIIPPLRNIGLVVSIILMFLFTVYVGAVLFRFFNRVPCSCGGVLAGMSWEIHFVFNVFFLAVGVSGLVWNRKHYKHQY